MEKRFLRIEEAAAYIGYKVPTIYGWVQQRRIPFVKKGGRLRFDKQKLDAWMESDAREAIQDNPGVRRKSSNADARKGVTNRNRNKHELF